MNEEKNRVIKEIEGTSKNKKAIQERGITLVALVVTILVLVA